MNRKQGRITITIQIILMGKRELVALLCLSSWCLVIVVWLFLTMPRVCLQFVIVVFLFHTHFLFLQVTDCLELIYILTKQYQNISMGMKAIGCTEFPSLS